MLYLVATPIGNLADFTIRAVETLQRCDYILCEDTRHSQHLLHHYQIKKPLKSYHAFNEVDELEKVIVALKEGKEIALISDAGTPLLADPGFPLVRRCKEEKIPITALPGANAALMALILSGFPTLPFQCVGFLPKKESERACALTRLLLYTGTTVCYETPHRLIDTLNAIQPFAPNRMLCVARELTKLHEECLSGTASQLVEQFSVRAPRGEIAIVIAPAPTPMLFEEMSLKELVSYLETEFAMHLNAAIKLAAELRAIPKKILYKEIHCNRSST